MHEATRLLLAIGLVGAAWAGAQAGSGTSPDAVIELWEQGWTLNADGATVYHEKKYVRLNSDRAYGEFADPRITYNVDTDELEIIAARVQRPDGTYCELPDYSHVLVSPDASAGWPAFANIRQHLLVMSGIEPGCLVELEYKITSKPGAKPYLAADVRLDHRYPVRERTVEVSAPASVPLSPVLNDVFTGQGKRNVELKPVDTDASLRACRCTFRDLPAAPDEPQSPPWQTRCARFAFSTAGTPEQWLQRELGPINNAANESALISKLASDWTKDLFQPGDKLRAIQEKLAGSFNFVEFDPAWRPAEPRRASTVLHTDYGTPEEAAAVLESLVATASIPLRLGVLTNDEVWMDGAPQKSFVAAYVVVVGSGNDLEVWDAHRGRIVRDGHWAGHTLLALTDGKLERLPLPGWTNPNDSRCTIGGSVTLDKDGNFAGALTLRTTGLFVSSESLRSSDAQKTRIGALLGRVLGSANVESFTVKTLAEGELEATAQVKSSKPMKKLGGAYILQLAQDGPFLADVPLPLAYSERTNPVRLTGPFDEQIELTIEWPKAWRIEAQPAGLARVAGGWGEVQQTVTPGENRLTLVRHTRIAQRELPAKEFLELRGPLNELRSESARTLMVQP